MPHAPSPTPPHTAVGIRKASLFSANLEGTLKISVMVVLFVTRFGLDRETTGDRGTGGH
ncbi:hypothetical protein V6Z12_A10G086800 [Gossypium hirsutum]